MNRSASAPCAALLIIAGLLFLEGCANSYKEGYKAGYDEGHAEGLNQGYQTGTLDGEAEGLAKGTQRAEEATASGRSWRLYLKPLVLSCLGGAATGIVLQYILLYIFRGSYHLHWLGIALVPGLSDSRCFRLQTQLGILALEKKRQLEEVKSRTELKNAQIEAVKKLAMHKIEARSDLESTLLKRILVDADREMQTIIEKAELHGTTPSPSRK